MASYTGTTKCPGGRPRAGTFYPHCPQDSAHTAVQPLQYAGSPGPWWGTPDGYDANIQKCFTLGILKHSIKICKCTTKEIKKNSITKAALPFSGLNTRTGLITEH